MNPLQRILIRLGLETTLQTQADEIAAQCAEVVAGKLAGNTEVSSLNEARGYVRARAARTIQGRVAELDGLTETCRQRLHEMVSDRLSQRFAVRVLQRPVVQRRAA